MDTVRMLPDGKQIELRPEVYYKFIGEGHKNQDLAYHVGLNVDPVPFNPDEWGAGIHFCELADSDLWMQFGPYMATVRVPKNARFVRLRNKLKADKIWIEEIHLACLHPVWTAASDPGLMLRCDRYLHLGFNERAIYNLQVGNNVFFHCIKKGLFEFGLMTKLFEERDFGEFAYDIAEKYIADQSWITDRVLAKNPSFAVYLQSPHLIISRRIYGSVGESVKYSVANTNLSPAAKFLAVARLLPDDKIPDDLLDIGLRYGCIDTTFGSMGSPRVNIDLASLSESQVALLMQNPYCHLFPDSAVVRKSRNAAVIDATNSKTREFKEFSRALVEFVAKFVAEDPLISLMRCGGIIREIYGGIVREASYAILNKLDVQKHVEGYLSEGRDINLMCKLKHEEDCSRVMSTLYSAVRHLNGYIAYNGKDYKSDVRTSFATHSARLGFYTVWIPHNDSYRRYDIRVKHPGSPWGFTVDSGHVEISKNECYVGGYKPVDMDALKSRELIILKLSGTVNGYHKPWKMLVRMYDLYSRGYQISKETALVCHLLLKKGPEDPYAFCDDYEMFRNTIVRTEDKPRIDMRADSTGKIEISYISSQRVTSENVKQFISEAFVKALEAKAAEWGDDLTQIRSKH